MNGILLANYHLLNTIALYDEFKPQGKTGLRHYVRSQYCKKELAYSAFEHLIQHAQFKYIFISYNNEGILKVEDIKNICTKYGHYDFIAQSYSRFKADNKRTYRENKTTEYLHILEKN